MHPSPLYAHQPTPTLKHPYMKMINLPFTCTQIFITQNLPKTATKRKTAKDKLSRTRVWEDLWHWPLAARFSPFPSQWPSDGSTWPAAGSSGSSPPLAPKGLCGSVTVTQSTHYLGCASVQSCRSGWLLAPRHEHLACSEKMIKYKLMTKKDMVVTKHKSIPA